MKFTDLNIAPTVDTKICSESPTEKGYLTPDQIVGMGGAALTYSEIDPNEGEPGTSQGISGSDDSGILSWTGQDPQSEGVIWSTDGSFSPAPSGVWWQLSRNPTNFSFYKFEDGIQVGIFFISNDLTTWPEDADWSAFGATVTRDGDPLSSSHIGQLCKASTAWWQWDGTLWNPIRTLSNQPILTNSDGLTYYTMNRDAATGAFEFLPFP